MTKVTEFKVGMTCDGCSSACTRILNKIEGVSDVKCDVEKQQILVEGDADVNVMLEALLKWSKASGKSVELVATIKATKEQQTEEKERINTIQKILDTF